METNVSDQNNSRRRSKILGFIIAETVAIGTLLLAGTFVLLARSADSIVVSDRTHPPSVQT